MRIYTNFGKENVYSIDYYRIEGKTLTTYSTNQDDDIFSTIKNGEPCCISLISHNNKYETYKECCLEHCFIENNSITFKSLDNHPCRR